MYAKGVLHQYYFNNEVLRGDDYYKLLDTYVQLEAQQFSQSIDFHHDGTPLRITQVARSLLDELSPSLWIEKYGRRV